MRRFVLVAVLVGRVGRVGRVGIVMDLMILLCCGDVCCSGDPHHH